VNMPVLQGSRTEEVGSGCNITQRHITYLLSQQPVFPRERTVETKPLPEANPNEYRKRFVWG
jgi:hypothetical protein